MSDSIYSPSADQVSQRRFRRHSPPTVQRGAISAPYDDSIAAILDAPLLAGEPAHFGFARKEGEMIAVLAMLPLSDQRALCARLSHASDDDVLAQKFRRLTVERRVRLLNFLGDARRRVAVSAARR